MSGTLIVSPTSCWIDAAGIHAPPYDDILNYFLGQYQSIYGADAYVENDAQDLQMLGVFSQAIHDANSATIAAYNAFSPGTAQGAGLSSVVKINGIKRLIPSNSFVDLVCVGQAGKPIVNGIAVDGNNNRWFLPSPLTIPISGQLVVTAIAEFSGAVTGVAGTINQIGTPTQGWQSVVNLSDASIGAPIELDAQLRQRQTVSTMLPSLAVLDGIVGAIEALPGVTRVQPYENNTSLFDSNGIPDHSIAIVVEGGSAQSIGDLILLKKTPGTGTYGTTMVTSLDTNGNPNAIHFFRPTDISITAVITLTPLVGYVTAVGSAVVAAVINALVKLPIGADVVRTRLIAAAYNPAFSNYIIANITLARGSATLAAADVPIAFNEAATGDLTTVTLIIG